MQDNPLVSVIIPCYNVSAYVEKAIRSILDQTYTNLEIWIIDDASTDDTLKKIRTIKDDRINLEVFKNNTQKVGAVNDILKKVKGDLICFQDADDWSEPGRIQKQLDEFRKDADLGICFTNYKYAGNKAGLPGPIAVSDAELRDEFHYFGYKQNKHLSASACPTMMISKVALDKTKGYHPYFAGRIAEDIQWVYRILKYYKGITVDKILYNYSSREGSLIQIQSTGTNPKFSYSFELLSKIIYLDIHKNIDILDPANKERLAAEELEACEEALVKAIREINERTRAYETSTSYRLGKLLLTPFNIFKNR